MLSMMWTAVIAALALVACVASLCLWLHEHGIRPAVALRAHARKMSIAGLCALTLWAAPLIQYGSSKPGGGTNNVPQMIGGGASLPYFHNFIFPQFHNSTLPNHLHQHIPYT